MQLSRRTAARQAPRMRGLSLVELMVGIAVSLFIVAAAALLASTQLSDNRRLLLETQLQQDLRATADIITRELRRSSYWDNAAAGAPAPIGSITVPIAVAPNPYAALSVSTSASSAVFYRYRRSSGVEAFGFKLTNAGVVLACQSDGSEVGGQCDTGWQELSDPNTVRITEFRISTERATNSANDDNQFLPCPYPCADGTSACWPKLAVRELTLVMTGVSRTDDAVVRTLRSSLRVRNDRVDLSTEAPAGQSCPAG